VDIDVEVRTSIEGLVNDQRLRGEVAATLNTGGGGRSECEFSHLPQGFNPATFGTHA
jgi:hypothetical protein